MNEILWLLFFWWIATRVLKAGKNRRKKNAAIPQKGTGAVEHLIAALLTHIKQQTAGRGAASLSRPAPWGKDVAVGHRNAEDDQGASGQKRLEKEVSPRQVAASRDGMVQSSVVLTPSATDTGAVAPATSKQRKISLQQAVVWSVILAPPVTLRDRYLHTLRSAFSRMAAPP